MRIRSEIIKSITDKLTSANWNRLKNSLVGKELIAFGGEVVSTAENVKDTLVDSLDYEKADFAGLVSLSQINDVYVSAFKPAFIKIKIKGLVQPLVYKPFDLVLTTGSSSFTNIDYCSSADEIILYQGVVKSAVTSGTPDQYSGFRVDTVVPYQITNFPSSDTSVKNFIILGENAMPESIYYFKRYNNVVSLISQYTSLRYSSEIEQYKIRTLSDVRQAIQLGDGVWGKSEYDAGTEFQAIWLELSSNEFSTEGSLVSTEYGAYTDSQVEFLASAFASYPDIEFARASYKKNMLITSVVASNSQIREFTNSYSYVLDSNVVLSNVGENLILIYIKPTDPNDIGGFGEIEAVLDLHGNIFSQHRTILGLPILFSVLVYADYNNQVQQFLVDKFSYKNLAYKEVIAAAATASEVQSLYQLSNYILFQVTQAASMYHLMNPIQGTIRLLDGNNDVVGFDSHGIIYKLIEDSNLDFLYGFGSSYGSSFLSNHFWDNGSVFAYQNVLFNLYSGETKASRKLANIIDSELIFDINSDIYSQQNSLDSPISGLRLKNETVDEFPVVLCSYPLDDIAISEPGEIVITNNKDAAGKYWFTQTGVNEIIEEIESHYSYYTHVSINASYIGCSIPNLDTVSDYIKLIAGSLTEYEFASQGDVGAIEWKNTSGVYNIINFPVIIFYHYSVTDIDHPGSWMDGLEVDSQYDTHLTLQFIVSGGAFSHTAVGKSISFNVFIDSMLWNFPDENSNTIQCIRSININANDYMSTSTEASEIVDYFRSDASRLPKSPFAPKVKFKDDNLYTVAKTSEGLVLYIFHIDTVNLGVGALTAKVVLSNNTNLDCYGLFIKNDNIFVRASDGQNPPLNCRVQKVNGLYTLRSAVSISSIDSYSNCYIYQHKDGYVIVYAELASGIVYNIHYLVADDFQLVGSAVTFQNLEEIIFYDTDGVTPIYNATEIHPDNIWTSLPQIAFCNQNYIGFIMQFQQFNGIFISATCCTYNRQTTEITRINSDNSALSAERWKYPSYTGTVDYNSGIMNPGNITWITTKYNTSLIQVRENQFYPKLNNLTPVIWM